MSSAALDTADKPDGWQDQMLEGETSDSPA